MLRPVQPNDKNLRQSTFYSLVIKVADYLLVLFGVQD
jgi:hypothetical protein